MESYEKPPDNYMRLLFVDPGTVRSGFVCIGVPGPPMDEETGERVSSDEYFPKHVYAYAERCLYNANANVMAAEAKDLVGDWMFDAFIIDKKAGMQTPMGFDHTVKEQYSIAFKAFGVKSRLTGYDFFYGSENVNARELQLKQWLERPPEGAKDPRSILIVMDHMTNLIKQIDDFYRKPSKNQNSGGDDVGTKRDDRIPLEMVHCLEYAAAWFNGKLYWNDPMPADPTSETDPCVRQARDWIAKGWELTGKPNKALNFGCNDEY